MMLYGNEIKQAESEKYLGWHISENSVSASAHETVMKRKGKVTRAIYQIKSIVEDKRCEELGAVNTGLLIWNTSVLPFLLHSCENWLLMKKETEKVLADLQADFFRALFCLPLSCPLPIMYFDTKSLLIQNRIKKAKLLFRFHLENLSSSSLAFEVLSVQKRLPSIPSLYLETQDMMAELGLGPVKTYTKTQWSKEVNRKIEEKNYLEIMSQIKHYKKLSYEELSKEEYKVKPYLSNLNLSQARVKIFAESKSFWLC